MICPNCKTEIEEGAAFCPNCGSAIIREEAPAAEAAEAAEEVAAAETAAEEPAPEAPKKSKKGLIIGICAAVVAAAVIAAVAVFGSNPLSLVSEAAKNTAEIRSAKAKELGTQMSVALNYDLTDLSADLLGVELPASADIAFAVDAADVMYALNASVSIKDNPFADVSAWLSKDEMVVSSDTLLGESYGVSLADMAQNLPGSVLNPEQGLFTQEEYDVLMNYAENLDKTDAFILDLSNVINSTFEVTANSAKSNSKAEKSKTEVDFGGEKLQATVVTVTFTGEQFANIVSDTVEYLKNDEYIKENLKNLSENFAELFEIYTGQPVAEALNSFNEGLENFDKQNIINEYGSDEIVLTVDFTVNSAKELVGIKGDFTPEDLHFDYQCGPDAAKPVYTAVSVKYGNEGVSTTYTISENNDSVYSAKASVDVEGAVSFDADIDWNKASGDFTVKSGDIAFKADVKKNGSVTVIVPQAIEGLGVDEYNDYLNKATITVSRSVEFPAIPEYKDLLTMSAEEIVDMADQIEAVPDTLLYGLYSFLF